MKKEKKKRNRFRKKIKTVSNKKLLIALIIVILLILSSFSYSFFSENKNREEQGLSSLGLWSFLINILQGMVIENEFLLDMGEIIDDDYNLDSFIEPDLSLGVSDRLDESGISYRTLDELGKIVFKIDTSSLNLADNGVPYENAILEVRYKDVIDETQENCEPG